MNFICDLSQPEVGNQEALGGKGWNLAVLLGAGLPVPRAFCVTTSAYREALSDGFPTPRLSATQRREIETAYQRLGRGTVAVRSSATLEDGADASFAGLQETMLDVEGEAAVADAVERCWLSLHSDRAKAYRGQKKIDEQNLAMAVVVQRLVPAEVSGVLFTRDPLDPEGQLLLIEAAWGLGDAVVSGRVTPDRFRVHRESGRLVERHVAASLPDATRESRRDLPTCGCLNELQLGALFELAMRVESVYGEPRDIEWAWANGQPWLLQARPITTAGAFEREQARRAEIARLATLADPRGTVWAKYNLSEVLPAPKPMTWSIVRRFMSGHGGMGLMLRDLGFDPDPLFDELGGNDLICGRTYVNLSREAKSHFRGLPYHHSLAEIREHPERAFYHQPTPDPSQVDARFVLRLPVLIFKMLRARRRLRRESRTLAERLRRDVFPRFLAEVQAARKVAIADLSDRQLLDRLHEWITRTLDELARWSLRPAVLAADALDAVQQRLARTLGAEQAAATARSLLSGVRPDPETDLAGDLQAHAAGRLSQDDFLSRHGHRGPQEMELAAPRWRDEPSRLVGSACQGSPAPTRQTRARDVQPPTLDSRTEADLERARTYMALRETGKHYLMLGYEFIRQALVELGRRHQLADDIFFLELDEVPRLISGEDLSDLATRRRKERQLLLSIDAPPVLFSGDLVAIGRPPTVVDAPQLHGTPASAGVVEGPALVLELPVPPRDLPVGFILVCPSTDPAWVPLFVRANGLIMETGGILSHGAIVARELNLPAVVGITQAVSRIRTGQRLRVNGNTGSVSLLE